PPSAPLSNLRTPTFLDDLELVEEGLVLALEALSEAPARSRVEEVDELLVGEVHELVEVHSAEGELLEGALLAQLRDLLGLVLVSHRYSSAGKRAVRAK